MERAPLKIGVTKSGEPPIRGIDPKPRAPAGRYKYNAPPPPIAHRVGRLRVRNRTFGIGSEGMSVQHVTWSITIPRLPPESFVPIGDGGAAVRGSTFCRLVRSGGDHLSQACALDVQEKASPTSNYRLVVRYPFE